MRSRLVSSSSFGRITRIALVGAALTTGGCAPARSLPERALLSHTADETSDARALRAIAFARVQLGKRYCWGGRGPTCFDCSGLVQAAYRYAGASVPRTSHDIAAKLPEVPLEEVRPGDILWWPGHVGLYVGNGWVIDASNARAEVVERPARDPFRAYRPPG